MKEGSQEESACLACNGCYQVYRRRPDVGAVVHAHPPVSTAFAVCRQGLTDPYLAELVVGLGEVPVTDGFAMLSTDQVPRSIIPFLPDHNAVLLCNHGAVTWGKDLWSAFDRMETVEPKFCSTSASWAEAFP